MPRLRKEENKKTFNSLEIQGYRANLVGEINSCTNGARIELDIKTARMIVKILDQAIHTEEGHEPPHA